MVPNDWQIKRFEEVAYVGNGQVDPREEPYLSMLHIGPENIASNSGQLSGTKKCSDLNLVSGKYEFDKNAIVYSKIRPNLNKICRPDFSGVCSADMYPIWAKADLNIDYLFYYMLGESFYKTAVSMSMRTGMPKINRTDLDAININIPPLPEQQKIAEILTTWDKAINTTERLIENRKQQKKALMQQLLTGQKRLLNDSGQRFSGDWEEVQLKTVLDLMKSGLSRKLENNNIGIAVIRSNNMGPKYTTDTELKYWYLEDPQGANVSNYILDNGDLLVNFINSLSQIGKACIYKKINNTEAIYTTNILRIKPNLSRIDPVYLYLVTQTSKYDSYITSITKPAVNQASFTTKDFGNYLFDLPSLKEQQKIAAVLTNADREIEVLEQQLADLQQEKKALMQQLLTGKKRVKVAG
ncbi:restriction endonuclease subunit S [Psychrobacter phenylpyruvicus]|uniref:Type I restriction enzyme EcoKI specificity protein n=1 Tax=Psychrobacter phenylpyruvicus TaxID=29432 RepID=A0A379LM71_9GAMM|nr:restriction endonuclease subunit S [Psychrobacter phenylpyruvicus]SUD90872.1 Type I restriction enzyme EcoKI specificity protein [Psychrobacter phenylpyruvicus]